MNAVSTRGTDQEGCSDCPGAASKALVFELVNLASFVLRSETFPGRLPWPMGITGGKWGQRLVLQKNEAERACPKWTWMFPATSPGRALHLQELGRWPRRRV